jgi:hypothetical protein
MRYEQILATLIIALLAGTVGAFLVTSGHTPRDGDTSALHGLNTSGTLRCGYQTEPAPEAALFAKDPQTGAFSGLWHELTIALAQQAKLELVWAPTTAATVASDLAAKKFDVLCTGLAPTLILAKTLAFSAPVYYRANQPYGFVTLASEPALRDFFSVGIAPLLADRGMDSRFAQAQATVPGGLQRAKPMFEPAR